MGRRGTQTLHTSLLVGLIVPLCLLTITCSDDSPSGSGGSGSGGVSGGGVSGGGSGGAAGGSGGGAAGTGGASPSPPEWLATTHSLRKFRPDHPLPTERIASIEAARNEIESFQIVIQGGSAGRTVQAATVMALSGPGGATINTGQLHVYRLGWFDVPAASNQEGAAGRWPDPLIPDIDVFYQQKRNAFPMVVPAGEIGVVWVDVVVPADAAPGQYSGSVALSVGGEQVAAPVKLRVRNFVLPSTPTLRTAFAGPEIGACLAHHGSYEACGDDIGGSGDDGVEHYQTLYARALLNHRISAENVIYYGPPLVHQDFSHFDAVYGPLLGGTAPTLLPGARLTTVRIRTSETQWVRAWRDHFQQRGYTATLFDYTCDEPPAGCAWSSIAPGAAPVRAGGVPSLVTTDFVSASDNAVLSSIDILVPLMNWMRPTTANQPNYTPRSAYDAWLAADDKRALWWYQSCISHGCGDGCGDGTGSTGYPPSYVIDTLAIQNRAMEWFTFSDDISGELYFQTAHQLETAWDDQCAFDGAGDGTLFYPGTPARVGGSRHIPIASVRLKHIRDGVEDYELLHLVKQLGDEAFAKQIAGDLFSNKDDVRVEPEALFEARRKLADRVEQLMAP